MFNVLLQKKQEVTLPLLKSLKKQKNSHSVNGNARLLRPVRDGQPTVCTVSVGPTPGLIRAWQQYSDIFLTRRGQQWLGYLRHRDDTLTPSA